MELSKELQEGCTKTAEAAGSFGLDTVVSMPVFAETSGATETSAFDPRVVSGNAFAERVARIQREGNTQHFRQLPECSSPAAENLTEVDLIRAGRLRELGRSWAVAGDMPHPSPPLPNWGERSLEEEFDEEGREACHSGEKLLRPCHSGVYQGEPNLVWHHSPPELM